MKKRNSFICCIFLISMSLHSTVSCFAEEPAIDQEETQKLSRQLDRYENRYLSNEVKNEAAINIFNSTSMSAYFSGLAGGSVLSEGLLATAAGGAVFTAGLVGVGLAAAYGAYKLGTVLGVATKDVLKTEDGLYEHLASDSSMKDELNTFATTGVNSSTGTYDFTAGLQKIYTQDVTANALMREFLPSETDHDAYGFKVTDGSGASVMAIDYSVHWASEPQSCIVGHDTGLILKPGHMLAGSFFILESMRLQQVRTDEQKTTFQVVGEMYTAKPGESGEVASEPFVYSTVWDESIESLQEKIQTKEEYFSYIQNNTTLSFGAVEQNSLEYTRKRMKTICLAYEMRQKKITQNMNELLSATENQVQFDPSGFVATLYDQPVVFDAEGRFIYQQSQEYVPDSLLGSIDITYNEASIPYDNSLTIKGRRGVVDKKTGDIVSEKNGKILVKDALGRGWTIAAYTTMVNTLKKYEEDEKKWYTLEDLYYDDNIKLDGMRTGHTIKNHVGKTLEELQYRLRKKKSAFTYPNAGMAVVVINAGIFTAKFNHQLEGNSTWNFGISIFDEAQNRVEFSTIENLFDNLNYGWGVTRADPKNIIHAKGGKVIIQKLEEKLNRKQRKYYIVTSYPDPDPLALSN